MFPISNILHKRILILILKYSNYEKFALMRDFHLVFEVCEFALTMPVRPIDHKSYGKTLTPSGHLVERIKTEH